MGAQPDSPPPYVCLRVVAGGENSFTKLKELAFLSGLLLHVPTMSVVTGQSVVEGRGVLPIHSEVPIIEYGLELRASRDKIEAFKGRCDELKLSVSFGEPW